MPSVVDNLAVKKVCVDDFAIRKRFSYRTVMADFETHRIIDMIPSRDVKEVKNGLENFLILRLYQETELSYMHQQLMVRIREEIPAVTVQIDEIKQLLDIKNRSKRIRFAHE